MPQQLLDRSNVITILEQIGSEGMAKVMKAHVGQESINSLFGHIGWSPLGIEEYELFDPMAVALLGSSAVMAGAQGFTEAVQKFWLCGGRRRMARVSSNWIRRDWYGVSLWHRPPSSWWEQVKIIIYS